MSPGKCAACRPLPSPRRSATKLILPIAIAAVLSLSACTASEPATPKPAPEKTAAVDTAMPADAMATGTAKPMGTNPMVGGAAMDASSNIVTNASAAPNLTTLVAAVKAAGLVETLQGAGPFTVFAPTNDAFAKLPKGTVEGLLKPDMKAALTDVLTYHVVAGNLDQGRQWQGNVEDRPGRNSDRHLWWHG
jgi:uncharacterized surface protein with fasciclin (FAS1) repeats